MLLHYLEKLKCSNLLHVCTLNCVPIKGNNSWCQDFTDRSASLQRILLTHNQVANQVNIFTALHVMQTRYCDENSVRLSVRPSVRHTRGL